MILRLGLAVASAMAGVVTSWVAATPTHDAEPATTVQSAGVVEASAKPQPRPITIDAPLVPIVMDGSTLVPPSDPDVLGRWGGQHGGSTIVTGHTVHTGGGALEHLDRFKAGQLVKVGGQVYTVRSNRTLDKDVVAQRAGRLFRQSGPARLVMVTCTDWDGTEFDANQVLVATPV